MAKPKLKFFGSLSLDGIKQAVTEVSSKVETHEKYGKQLKVTGAQWDDNGISLQVYNPDTKESFNIGRLLVSQFEDNVTAESAKDADLPF